MYKKLVLPLVFHKVISGSGNFCLHDTRQDVCPNLVVHQIKINKNVWEYENLNKIEASLWLY